MRRIEVDRGSCGECQRFGNDPRMLGSKWAMDDLGMVEGPFLDENDPPATGTCPYAIDGTSLVSEDEPACPRKVEPPYLPPRIRARRERP